MAGGDGTGAARKRLADRYREVADERARQVVGFSRHDGKSQRLVAHASILADGNRVRDAGKEQMTREQARQIEAWSAYETMGEVTTLVDGTAGLLSQCRFYVGRRERDGDQTVDVPIEDISEVNDSVAAAVTDIFDRFTDESGAQAGLVRSIAQNWSVVGRCKMVGYSLDLDGKPVATPRPGSAPVGFTEVWQAVAPTSLWASKPATNVWTLQVGEGKTVELESPIVYDLLWQHPRWPKQSLGWVMAALDVCRDLRAFTLGQRSAARSGIPADVLLVPVEASPKKPAVLTLDDEGTEGSDPSDAANEFAEELEEMLGEYLLDVVNDSDSGMAIVPAILALAGDHIEKFDKISFSRQVDRGLGELVNQARSRLAEMADCPPEMLHGLGATNRWNGGQIAEQEYRRYFKPKADAIADAFTMGPFRHGMEASGLLEVMSALNLRVLVDPGEAVANPDYSKLALGLMDRGVLGPKGVRRLLSIPESYAPSPEELAQMIEWKGAGKPKPSDNTGRGDQGPPSGTPEVDNSKGAVITGHLVDAQLAITKNTTTGLADNLFRVELETRGRLEEACEAALDRAVDRAQAKLKNWARKSKMNLEVFTPEQAQVLRDQNEVSDEEMWLLALGALALAFRRIAHSAYGAAQKLIGATIPQAEIDAAIARAEGVLIDGMMALANEQVFGPPPGTTVGELSDLRVPSPLMRRVLAVAGGALGVGAGLDPDPESAFGLAFGPLLRRILPEIADLEWVYGPGHRTTHFQPHLDLDGQTFSGPTDPALAQDIFSAYPYFWPGDHRGCLCLWRPRWSDEVDMN